jgi:hypothetical protein
VDYMCLHTIVDTAVLSRLKVLRITCESGDVSWDATKHHQDVLDRMHLPVLEKVVVAISSYFDSNVSEAEVLMPFASAARRGILTYDIDPNP